MSEKTRFEDYIDGELVDDDVSCAPIKTIEEELLIREQFSGPSGEDPFHDQYSR